MLITLLPVLLLAVAPPKAQPDFGWVDYLGWVLFAVGYYIEAAADNQK